MKKIAILTSGNSRGSNFSAISAYFEKNQSQVNISFIVITGKNAPVAEIARQRGVRVLFIPTKDMQEFEKVLLAECRQEDIDLIALAGFLKKLSGDFICAFGKPILNVHPALLPKYGGRGMYGEAVHNAVYESGDDYSGVTIHLVNENYDAGDIITQKKVNIADCKSAQEIAGLVLKLEHSLYAPTIIKTLNR